MQFKLQSIFVYGLAPGGQQIIAWANDDPVHERIYASIGVNELSASENDNDIPFLTTFTYDNLA